MAVRLEDPLLPGAPVVTGALRERPDQLTQPLGLGIFSRWVVRAALLA